MSLAQPPALAPRSIPQALRLLAGLLRVHQWVKNALVFVPVVAAHTRGSEPYLQAALGFVAFSLCASSAYIANDLLDLENDRKSPARAGRPIAAGLVTPRVAALVGAACFVAGMSLAATTLPASFAVLAGCYWSASVAYSLRVKRVPLLDVIVLAGLYAVRVLGGTLATGVPTSSWLFTFAMFLFFSLALVKRASGLQLVPPGGGGTAGRGYRVADLEVLSQLGIASGFVAVLVLALYISNPDVTRLYSHHERLWLLCPLAMYWIGRIWLLTRRGLVHEDPVVFALRDRPSYLLGLGAAIVLYLSV
jgi:4-hydroxybenzoate polyprenyltransferase